MSQSRPELMDAENADGSSTSKADQPARKKFKMGLTKMDEEPPKATTKVPNTEGKEKPTDDSAMYTNKDVRDRCIAFVLVGTHLIQRFVLNSEKFNDILIADIAGSIFRSAHDSLRKASGVIPDVEKERSIFSRKCILQKNDGTYYYDGFEVATMLKYLATTHFELNYGIDKKLAGNWFGTMAPVVTYLTTFKNRVEELRLGNTIFEEKERKDGVLKTTKRTLAHYGFSIHHAPLFEGNNFPPEIRGAMLSALGPGTQILCMIQNKNPGYAGKYIKVLNETFKAIKNIDSVWRVILSKPGTETTRRICGYLLDIALCVTARNHHRGTPPMSMAYRLLSETDYKKFEADEECINSKVKVIIDMSSIKQFDFSSFGYISFMAARKNEEYLFSDISVEFAKQIVYHAAYGTQYEDFSILNQITDNNGWASRQTLGNAFLKIGSKPSTTTFKPIVNTVGSKFRTATLTDIMPKDNIQVVTTPIFAGKRTTPLLEVFIEIINKGLNVSVAASEDSTEVLNSLITLRTSIAQIITTKEKLNYGTVPWFKVDGVFPHAEGYEIQYNDTVYEGTNTYFHELDKASQKKYEFNEDKAKKWKKAQDEVINKL